MKIIEEIINSISKEYDLIEKINNELFIKYDLD
jgi:hypothetical protein